MKRFSSVRALFLGTVLVAAAASCGSDSGSNIGSPAEDSTAVGVTSGDGVGVDAPERIVSLSPTHTEILFALGAGEQVVAVDAMSNHPPESADLVTALSGFEPNVESIVSYQPDLVVIGDDFNDLAGQLEQVGIASWVDPAPLNLDEVLSQMEDLGRRIGRSSEAAALVATLRTEIDDIVESIPALTSPLSYYHELDESYFTVTSNTFIGSLYELFGLRNIADAAEADSDYPQLSAEFIISQNPDIVFLADTKCCAVSATSVASRPGWDSLAAVRNGQVVELDDDIASRWGPRIVDFIRSIAAAVAAMAESSN